MMIITQGYGYEGRVNSNAVIYDISKDIVNIDIVTPVTEPIVTVLSSAEHITISVTEIDVDPQRITIEVC